MNSFSFAFRLLSAKKVQYALVFFGIFFGVLSLFFFLSLSEGIKTGILKNTFQNVNTITVSYFPKKFSLLEKPLTDETREKILKIEGVEDVAREFPLVIPATAQSRSIPFPVDFFFIRGVDSQIFTKHLSDRKKFVDNGETLPIFISPFAIDFLNSFSSSIIGFSGIDTKTLTGKKGNITFGKSTFFSAISKSETLSRDAEIYGLSSFAPMLGIAIPMETAIDLSKKFNTFHRLEYSKLYVFVKTPEDFLSVKAELEKMNFLITSDREKSEEVSHILLILQGVLLFSSALILFVAGLFLFSTLSLSVLEHKKTIGILKSIGMSRERIIGIFLFKGIFLSLFATVFALLIGYVLIFYGNTFLLQILPDASFVPENIFSFDFSLALFLFCGVFLLSALSSLWPAYKASRVDPIVSLVE
jgi:ABC-type lipoprotein release transport system permease subunit